MHDYEVLKFGGVCIFGLCIAFFLGGSIGTLVGVILFVFGAIGGMYHHTLHSHMTMSSGHMRKY